MKKNIIEETEDLMRELIDKQEGEESELRAYVKEKKAEKEKNDRLIANAIKENKLNEYQEGIARSEKINECIKFAVSRLNVITKKTLVENGQERDAAIKQYLEEQEEKFAVQAVELINKVMEIAIANAELLNYGNRVLNQWEVTVCKSTLPLGYYTKTHLPESMYYLSKQAFYNNYGDEELRKRIKSFFDLVP